MGKEQIIKTIKSPKVQKFLQEKGIAQLSLFGSYATGKTSKDSDIDFLFKKKNSFAMSLFDLIVLTEYLEKLFQKHVDLVSERGLNKHIKHDILLSKIDIL